MAQLFTNMGGGDSSLNFGYNGSQLPSAQLNFGGQNSTPAPTPIMSAPATQQTATQAPATSTPSNSGAYQQLGGWNPYQYATNDTTNNLAKSLGARATLTAPSSPAGPNIPQQGTLDFGNGYVANAGLTQQMIDVYGKDYAMKMLADMQRQSLGGPTTTGTDPSLVGYDPSITPSILAKPVTPEGSVAAASLLGQPANPASFQFANQAAPQVNQTQDYINTVLGGQQASAQGSSNQGVLAQLLSLFGGMSQPSTQQQSSGMDINSIMAMLTGQLQDSFTTTRPRYNLFY